MGKPMIGKHLKSARLDKGMTQKELAQMLGFTESTISAWENQVRAPSYRDLMRLCAFFDMTVDDFFHGKIARATRESNSQGQWTFGVEYTMLSGTSFAAQRELLLIQLALVVLGLSTAWMPVFYLAVAVGVFRVLIAFYYLLSVDRKKVMVNYGFKQKPMLEFQGSDELLERINDQQMFLMFFGMLLGAFGVLFFSVQIEHFTSSALVKWLLIGLGMGSLLFEVQASMRFFDTFGYKSYDISLMRDPMSMTSHDLSVVMATILTAVYLSTMLYNAPGRFWSDMTIVTGFVGLFDYFRIELHKQTKTLRMRYVLKIIEDNGTPNEM